MYFTAYQIAMAEYAERNARYNRAQPAEGMRVETHNRFDLALRLILAALSALRARLFACRQAPARLAGAAQ
jgi:hypothetical protein